MNNNTENKSAEQLASADTCTAPKNIETNGAASTAGAAARNASSARTQEATKREKNKKTVRFITGIGVFSALAYLTTCLCKLIPNVAGFLSIDAKDAVIAIASFIYGPVAAPIIALITSFIEFVSISETGIWGMVMNFVSSTAFSLTAALIYRFRKSFNTSVIGFGVATVVTTAVMVALNPIIVPLYSGASREMVVSMIPGILLPFNFAKTLMNSAIAILLYKPVINALRAAKLVKKSEHKTVFNKISVLTISIGLAALITALVILLIIW